MRDVHGYLHFWKAGKHRHAGEYFLTQINYFKHTSSLSKFERPQPPPKDCMPYWAALGVSGPMQSPVDEAAVRLLLPALEPHLLRLIVPQWWSRAREVVRLALARSPERF